jgi:hypothetical protein
MRFLPVVLSAALIAVAVSCSGSSGPASTRPELHSLAAEICGELKPYSLADGQHFLAVNGLNAAQTVVDRADPGHIVTIQEYSDALDSVCPQTVRRFLGDQSFYDWLTD